MRPAGRIAAGVTVFLVLAGVFYLYSRPDFLVQMVNQLWSCF
jgi:hypothetical protein